MYNVRDSLDPRTCWVQFSALKMELPWRPVLALSPKQIDRGHLTVPCRLLNLFRQVFYLLVILEKTDWPASLRKRSNDLLVPLLTYYLNSSEEAQ